jgi:hypothetical protein
MILTFMMFCKCGRFGIPQLPPLFRQFVVGRELRYRFNIQEKNIICRERSHEFIFTDRQCTVKVKKTGGNSTTRKGELFRRLR